MNCVIWCEITSLLVFLHLLWSSLLFKRLKSHIKIQLLQQIRFHSCLKLTVLFSWSKWYIWHFGGRGEIKPTLGYVCTQSLKKPGVDPEFFSCILLQEYWGMIAILRMTKRQRTIFLRWGGSFWFPYPSHFSVNVTVMQFCCLFWAVYIFLKSDKTFFNCGIWKKITSCLNVWFWLCTLHQLGNSRHLASLLASMFMHYAICA